MTERNLLITIIDTNPLWWGLNSTGLINKPSNTNASKLNLTQDNFTLNDCLSAVVGFLNCYKSINQNNAIALIAAHNTKAEYLYPSGLKVIDKNSSPWDKFEQIGDIDDQIKENLKNLADSQLGKLTNEINNKDHIVNDSMVTSALGLGLCYINRIQRKNSFAETVNYRFLVIKASEDNSNQYMNFMNMIFSAEKLNVIIDSCTLMDDSSLLQQASYLTNGFYFKVPQISGLLNYLLWLFLPDVSTRKMLVYPPNSQVDFRAACFCHQKVIDVGYVCSVCLSVFCSFTPICTTCNCNFRFDVNMLKKATSLKKGLIRTQHLQPDQPVIQEQSESQSRLISQFQDTSINSPQERLLAGGDAMEVNSPMRAKPTAVLTTKIITAQANPKSNTNQSKAGSSSDKNFDDSFDMLE